MLEESFYTVVFAVRDRLSCAVDSDIHRHDCRIFEWRAKKGRALVSEEMWQLHQLEVTFCSELLAENFPNSEQISVSLLDRNRSQDQFSVENLFLEKPHWI